MDLISVVIPYYKKKDTISDTVNSVLKQTNANNEIIFVFLKVIPSGSNFFPKCALYFPNIII